MRDLEIPLGKRSFKYRFFEMLPALASYTLLATPIILSLTNPLLATIFIMLYLILWFIRVLGMSYRTIIGYQAIQLSKKINWWQRLKELECTSGDTVINSKEWHATKHFWNIQKVAANRDKYYKPSEIFNVVLVPLYKERREIVELTVKSIIDSHYSLENMMFILAYEERAGKDTEAIAQAIIAKYGKMFYHAKAIMHPCNLPNEIEGKGANITYAANYLKSFLERSKIDPDKVIVTTLDADNRPDPYYFAYLTYEYILDLDHQYKSYQPVSLYMNNIWDVPAPIRVLAIQCSFWAIISLQRKQRLRNFSSHAQGMSSLIHTNFWSVRTVVEDGHQYWRSYFSFKGNYEVEPLFIPIYQDAVFDRNYWKNIKSQFIQLQRWAYGASDIAYVADKGFGKHAEVPFWSILWRFLVSLEGNVNLATASIIVAFGPLFISHSALHSIAADELLVIVGRLPQIAMVGLFITIFLTFKILPPRPARYKRHRNILMVLQWLLMPIISICYGSAVALCSQTRLLLGKYLDKFDVTVKAIKN